MLYSCFQFVFFPNSTILKIFPTDTFPNLNPVLIKDRNSRPPSSQAPAWTRAMPSTTRTSTSRRSPSSWSLTGPMTTRLHLSLESLSRVLRCWTSWYLDRPSIRGRLTSRPWPCPTHTVRPKVKPPRARTDLFGSVENLNCRGSISWVKSEEEFHQ